MNTLIGYLETRLEKEVMLETKKLNIDSEIIPSVLYSS